MAVRLFVVHLYISTAFASSGPTSSSIFWARQLGQCENQPTGTAITSSAISETVPSRTSISIAASAASPSTAVPGTGSSTNPGSGIAASSSSDIMSSKPPSGVQTQLSVAPNIFDKAKTSQSSAMSSVSSNISTPSPPMTGFVRDSCDSCSLQQPPSAPFYCYCNGKNIIGDLRNYIWLREFFPFQVSLGNCPDASIDGNFSFLAACYTFNNDKRVPKIVVIGPLDLGEMRVRDVNGTLYIA